MLVEFRYEATVLGPTLRRGPDVKLRAEQTDVGRDNVQQTNFSVATSDLEEFEETVGWDETITDVTRLYADGEVATYHVQYRRGIVETLGYLAALDHGGEFRHAHSEADEWVVRMLFPGRRAFGEFVDACGEYGLEIEVDALRDVDFEPEVTEYGLTDAQREAILEAYAQGYFSVPQETTLEALSDNLGVSQSAVSGRLHRGVETLVANTVARDDGQPR